LSGEACGKVIARGDTVNTGVLFIPWHWYLHALQLVSNIEAWSFSYYE